MINVILNPGSGEVEGATLRQAWKSIRALRRAADISTPIERRPLRDECGRYGFRIGRCVVDMPGRPPSELRGDDIWTPRIYVDGSSWRWRFAAECLRESALEKKGGRR
jgi:hypothetical protein